MHCTGDDQDIIVLQRAGLPFVIDPINTRLNKRTYYIRDAFHFFSGEF